MSESTRLRDAQELSSPYNSLHDSYVSNKTNQKCSVSALVATGCLIGVGILLAIVVIEKIKHEKEINEALNPHLSSTCCNDTDPNEQSSVVLVESFPEGVDLRRNSSAGSDLYEAWRTLLSLATEQIDVASFYWSLTDQDIGVNSTADTHGRAILEEFKALASRNVSVRVVSSIPTLARNSTDLEVLQKHGVHVRRVDFGRLTKGILHSKFWIVDRRHLYIGSANMDWRALTQVRELGVLLLNSSTLAVDLQKIFESYWMMGVWNSSIPQRWPDTLQTHINEEQPLNTSLSGVNSRVYITASPPAFCPDSRTHDLSAILSAIRGAQSFIHVSVMEYYPASKYFNLHGFWPVLEDALKRAAFDRRVFVRLLVSCGRESDPSVWPFLRSLDALHSPSDNINIAVRVFIIPAGNQTRIPYTRINHSKYMVTDKLAYIGTSNWSADYFNTTAGVGLVVSQDALQKNSFQQQLRAVFQRDWSSEFSIPLSELQNNHDCAFPTHTP